MKVSSGIKILGGTVLATVMCAGLAQANPAMLPDHPGHPMKALKSPVTGQSLANDPGRDSWVGDKALTEAIESDNTHFPQENSKDTNVTYKGANVLPELAKGYPDYKITPPVTQATIPNR